MVSTLVSTPIADADQDHIEFSSLTVLKID